MPVSSHQLILPGALQGPYVRKNPSLNVPPECPSSEENMVMYRLFTINMSRNAMVPPYIHVVPFYFLPPHLKHPESATGLHLWFNMFSWPDGSRQGPTSVRSKNQIHRLWRQSNIGQRLGWQGSSCPDVWICFGSQPAVIKKTSYIKASF